MEQVFQIALSSPGSENYKRAIQKQHEHGQQQLCDANILKETARETKKLSDPKHY